MVVLFAKGQCLRQPSAGGEGHFALQVRLREDQHVPNVPKIFELICTSKDDTWQLKDSR